MKNSKSLKLSAFLKFEFVYERACFRLQGNNEVHDEMLPVRAEICRKASAFFSA